MAPQKPPYGDSVLVRGAKIRAARHALMRSASWLAAEVGVSPATIGHMETGRYPSTAHSIAVRVAAALGADIDDLFDASYLGYTVDGPALRAAREAGGTSRVALAEEIGVSPATIEQLENGTRRLLWRETAEQIAAVLGRPVCDMFTEQDTAVLVSA